MKKNKINGLGFISTLSILFFLFVIAILPAQVYAAGGFGGVSAISTKSSFKVSWNWNANNFQGDSGDYIKICYKRATSIVPICKSHKVTTSSAPKLISGLKPGKKYKIKVFCKCKKKRRRGGWKKAKWRKVGTLTQSTKPSINSNKYSGVLSIRGTYVTTTLGSIKVKFSAGNVQGSDLVRVCYKKTYSWNNLKNSCKRRDTVWRANGNRLGVFEKKPGGSFSHTFKVLNPGQQYKFVAVVFPTGGAIGKIVSKVKGHTPKAFYNKNKAMKASRKGTYKKGVMQSQGLSGKK